MQTLAVGHILRYKDDVRTVIPGITYPYGDEPINLEIGQQKIEHLAVGDNEDGLTLFVSTESGPRLINFEKECPVL